MYVLQLEEYNVPRYLKQIRKRWFYRHFEKRDKLVFTLRVKLTLALSATLIVFTAILLTNLNSWLGVVWLLTLPLSIPLILPVASSFIAPLTLWQTHQRLLAAHNYFVAYYPNTKVIAITGSYGKTTTKYALHAFLEYTFKVAFIPDNINTPLGIADYILQHQLPTQTDYLIVEMGAYTIGDIATSCQVLPPDIAIITALGDQHLERFGSFNNLVTAKHEIFEIQQTQQRFAPLSVVKVLSKHNYETDNITTVPDSNEHTNLAAAVATALGVKDSLLADATKNFQLPSRRNQCYELAGVTIIDNSYNISPITAAAIIREATAVAKIHDKKLVVMTAGIAEQGDNSVSVNNELGGLLNRYASRVILHPSCYTNSIKQTLTIPYQEVEFALTVINSVGTFVNGQDEILLHLPEHSDLAYFN